MPRKYCFAWLLIIAGCVLANAARVLAGPVNYVSQARSISSHLREEFDLPKGGQAERLDNDVAEAPDFGDFDASVVSMVDDIPPDQPARSGRVFGSQRSTLHDSGISVSGQFNGITGTDDGGYTLRSFVDAVFDLPRPQTYTLTYLVDRFMQNDGSTRIALGTSGSDGSVFDLALVFDEFPPEGTLIGTLVPGRYHFQFQHVVGGDVSVHGPYNVDLALEATAIVVPLPPGAAAFAATVAGATVIGIAVRRRRAARPGRVCPC